MDDFFSMDSLATMTGCVAAVVVILNTIRNVFQWGPRWFGLALSIIISIVGFLIVNDQSLASGNSETEVSIDIKQIAIIILNGCLIYTSAFGIQSTVVQSLGSEYHDKDEESLESVSKNKKERKISWTDEW